jgi:PhnB protein
MTEAADAAIIIGAGRSPMKLHPHLSLGFNGQCQEAFTLYERALQGTITFMLTWADSPMAAEAPPDWGGKVYHATLKVGDTVITGGDVSPEKYEAPRGFSVILRVDEAEAAERIFAALSEGGDVQMPLQETFWASRFGTVTDRFGIPWSINCEQPADAIGSASERGAEARTRGSTVPR